jgi:hypothetical protein
VNWVKQIQDTVMGGGFCEDGYEIPVDLLTSFAAINSTTKLDIY